MARLLRMLVAVVGIALFAVPTSTRADNLQPTDFPLSGDQVTGTCIVRWFDTLLDLQKDSSASITETIQMDCGDLEGKHGLFRTIPYKFPNRLHSEYPITAITLQGIEDQQGRPYLYTTIYENDTVTWKIGDPLTTITGVHTYVIRYKVENTIEHTDLQDVLAWNLSGAFWQLPIERYTGRVQFPADLRESDLDPKLYSGENGATDNGLQALGRWLSTEERATGAGPTYYVQSTNTLSPGEGITTYITTPKYFTPYELPPLLRYGRDAWLFVPIIILLLSIYIWSKYGRDPRPPGAQMVFYEPPHKLAPLLIGLVDSYGRMRPSYVTATIIDLAAKGVIKITEVQQRSLFKTGDWEFTLLMSDPPVQGFEREVLRGLFTVLDEGNSVKASDLSNAFYTHLPTIGTAGKRDLYELEILDKAAEGRQAAMYAAAVIIGIGGMAGLFIASSNMNPMENWLEYAPYTLGASGVILLIVASLMGRRSEKGARAEYEIKGFREFLSATEKYRAAFQEKELKFERLLPYAVLFGVTDQFLKGLASIYSEEQLRSMYPTWYMSMSGGQDLASFSGFSDNLSHMTQQIGTWAASTPSGSGRGGFSGGGGGFSGGGFGGGGGGSW